MKIALVQINTTVWDFARNHRKICKWAGWAQSRGADLVVFPELCVCGYPPEDLAERPGFWADNQQAVQKLAAALPGIPMIVGYVTKSDYDDGKPARNCAAVLAGGEVKFEQSKMLLPTYDVLDESRNFEPAREQKVFEFLGKKIALTICEDAWSDEDFWPHRLYQCDPVKELMEQGSDLIINVSASPFAQGKRTLRRDLFRALARKYRIPVVLVNHVGGNDSLIFDGSSLAIDATGEVRAEAKAFEEDMVLFDTETGEGEIHAQPGEGVEEVYHALVLGLRDYVVKCGFKKVVVGMSGGIDSSVVAALAFDALGAENVIGVTMPGPFSSAESLEDARAMAEGMGIVFHEMGIQETFDAYRRTLSPVFAGKEEDVTEENLQARIRGNLIMAYSNKFGALMLSTGNKSELAVGYCTLYGDLAGGLAVISDVPKTQVYELARYLNREVTVIPERILTRAPSAELRPNQTDQDTLPPYEVLDKVLHDYIKDKMSAREIVKKEGQPLELVQDVIRRVQQSEYKRRQAPPGLKVSAKAFGLGRRYPIAKKYSSPE